ncbi:MAG: hypothetical protein JSS82_08870 [Bacteroidetes bacterium]|nr:hypothetical protein [Bacteroidota bacterium]
MPGYDDPGYGCDNDLNNYSHDGSSVLNDSGSDDSGSSGFSWGDLVSSGSNGNSGNSYARSGNPYQPYMPQTNYTNAFTPQGNNTDYSSYGNNANFQKPAKPTPPKQAHNPYNPGTPVLNTHVTNNNNTTDRDVLDTGNLLGKNPLKKNVLFQDVLDAKSKGFLERTERDNLLLVLPIIFFSSIWDFNYRYRATIFNPDRSPKINPNNIVRNSSAYKEFATLFSENGIYGKQHIELFGASADLSGLASSSGYSSTIYRVSVKGATSVLVHIAGTASAKYSDLASVDELDGNSIDSVRIGITMDNNIKDYEFFTFFAEELVHAQENANMALKFMQTRDFATFKANYMRLVNEESNPATEAHQSIGKNQGIFKQMVTSFLNTIYNLPLGFRTESYGGPLLITHPVEAFNVTHEVIGSFYNRVVMDINNHMMQIMRAVGLDIVDAYRVYIKNFPFPLDITNETH